MASYLPSADMLSKISESWELLTDTFGELTHSSENESVLQNVDILSSLENLCNFDLDRSFIDWYYDEIRQYLKEEIVEPFRNKSRNILSSHYQQLIHINKCNRKKSKLQKRLSMSSIASADNDPNHNQRISDHNNTIQFMNFETFDIKIWSNFLKEISSIVEELYREIFKIKNNILQITTLLNTLYSSKYTKTNHLSNDTLHILTDRLNILIDTIFLIDGTDEFQSIFRIMFEYSFIYFSQMPMYDNMRLKDDLVIEWSNICNKLHKLRWLKILESVFINVGYHHIEYELYRNYQSRKSNTFIDYVLFEEPLLHRFKTWLNEILFKWLHIITEAEHTMDGDHDDVYMKTPSKQHNNTNTRNIRNKNDSILCLTDLKQKIEYFVYEKFGEMRTREMFDIILVYPQSVAALEDLKQCLNVTSQWRPLQISMLSSFKKRLLHHGASSKDIITQYIATIGALKMLDPTGITLEIVGEPMRIYLREREDAIRCVVSHLMENDTSLLREYQEKLIKRPKKHMNSDIEWDEEKSTDIVNDDGNESDDSVQSDIEDAKQWEPDPLDSMFAKTSIFKRNSDTIGLLVKIFGSREIFVEEYRKLLGDRLLSRQSHFFRVDKETEYLELMKLRFGDESMEDCNVMVQDIMNSERDTQNIKTLIESQMLSATIISAQYWPQTMNGNDFEVQKTLGYTLPKDMARLYTSFEETYARIKKPREIFWIPNEGCVDLEIILNSQIVKIKTAPINASLLMIMQEHFEQELKCDYVDTDELCGKIGMNEDGMMPSLLYWIKRGIIKRVYKENEFIGYRLADGKDEEMYAFTCLKKKSNQNIIDEQDDAALSTFSSEKETISADFERTVLGVLTVFQGSPIERIMTLLKQMKLHPLYAKISINQLQNILDKLANEKRVIFENGMYKRARQN